jgi:Transposase DDE domain group 1
VIGRQLARVSAVNYHETLWSELYPGNRLTMACLQPAVLAVENALELTIAQRKRTVYRLDGGSGTDENLRWLLQRHYQTVAKGFSGKRANALAAEVQRWDHYDETSFLGTVPDRLNLGRPVTMLVRKRLQHDQWKHSYYVSTLAFPSKQAFFDRYSQRGAAEIEQFRTDKSGLHLSARRMRSFEAQKALILLTDLAHNLLADFQRRALLDSPFADWGLKRIVRDLLAIPGRLYFVDRQLKRIELLATHPYADDLLICLEKYCSSRLAQ